MQKNIKALRLYYRRKAQEKQGTCQQGERADLTGCTPASGEGGRAQPPKGPKVPTKPAKRAVLKDTHQATEDAKQWVESRESWAGKVEAVPGKVDVREVVKNPGVTLTKTTVQKYERQILKEIEDYGRPQRPLVVSKRADGKYFLQDGNHYYAAMFNLAKAGKLRLGDDKTVPVVEVKPKDGYKFEAYVDDRYYIVDERLVPEGGKS